MSRKTLGHLTYRNGKPVPGLCYCDTSLAHDAEPEPHGKPAAGLSDDDTRSTFSKCPWKT